MVDKQCIVCGKPFQVIPARAEIAKLCSNECRWKLQKTTRLGAANGRWKGGSREKKCQRCGETFCWSGEPHVSWLKRKFCSKTCVVAGQDRLYGARHPKYNPEASKRKRGQEIQAQGIWSRAVRKRDNYTCQKCGKRGGRLHAHHLKTWATHPELRNDVANGITLCVKCHHAAHGYKENRVKSVKRQNGQYRANPRM